MPQRPFEAVFHNARWMLQGFGYIEVDLEPDTPHYDDVDAVLLGKAFLRI